VSVGSISIVIPVFNERVDGDFYEIALSVDYKLPFFGGENWYASGVIAYADEDAEVEFHDQTNLLSQPAWNGASVRIAKPSVPRDENGGLRAVHFLPGERSDHRR